mgnify:CR=1 FL=1
MLNRSAVVIGHEPAFYGWLRTTGIAIDSISMVEDCGRGRIEPEATGFP